VSADRVALFEADIAASPSALTTLLDSWVGPALGGRPRLVFIGLGSSRFAALIVAAQVRAAGATAWVEYASTSAPTAPAADLVVVAISASGRTREVLDAAERHRGRSLVIAVTNDAASPLAGLADLVVALQAGEERSGIAARTYRATIAALALLTGVATVASLRPVVGALADRLATSDAWCPSIVDALEGAPSIDVLADASLLGLAEQAALMLREAPRLPAHAYDSGDWLHTGVYLALPGHRVLLYPGAACDDEVIDTVERRGGVVSSAAPTAGAVLARAIVDSVVAERVAAALWRRTSAHDKVP